MELIADNYQDLYIETLDNIQEHGLLVGDTKELRNITLILTNPYSRMVWLADRKPNYTFAMQFFLWLLNARDDLAPLLALNKNAIRYANPGTGKLSTAYGPRIVSQLDGVIKELQERPDTRRAVISILKPEDNDMLVPKSQNQTNEEYPCTDHFVFSLRQEGPFHYLDMCTVMRSNNMVDTVIYDVFAFTMLQEYVLRRLNSKGNYCEMGTYTHFVHSAHIYNRDSEKVLAMLNSEDDHIHLPLVFTGESKSE